MASVIIGPRIPVRRTSCSAHRSSPTRPTPFSNRHEGRVAPRIRRRTLLFSGIAAASGIGQVAAQVLPHPAAAPKLSPEDARAIAKDAYIFAYPLVLYYRTMYRQAIDTKSPSYAGGFGHW